MYMIRKTAFTLVSLALFISNCAKTIEVSYEKEEAQAKGTESILKKPDNAPIQIQDV